MKIAYVKKRWTDAHLTIVEKANSIIEEYQGQGFDLTLRQLYYQFVARDIIPNNQREYKRLGEILNDARLGGLVSWTAIVDRTRNLMGNTHWASPAERIRHAARAYQIDKWEGQEFRLEVWIEKDALAGVIENVCLRNDLDYFSCRGYTSQSELWSAARRMKGYLEAGQTPIVIHLGDHDPSGIDMSRDIKDRLKLFTRQEIDVRRVALNMNQVTKYKCPPNPAKLTDSRATGYVEKHGYESWELDALEPKVIEGLIEKEVMLFRNARTWNERVKLEKFHREELAEAADRMENEE